MAAEENIGNLSVGVTADLSDVDQALNQFIERATGAGADIADAMKQFMDMAAASVDGFGASATTAGEQLSLFGSTINDIPFADASGQLNLFTTELEQVVPAATDAAGATQIASTEVANLTAQTMPAAEATMSLATAMGELGQQLQGIAVLAGIAAAVEQLGQAALGAYETLENATVALTALSGSAEQATQDIAALRDLANSDALAFDKVLGAGQKMTALGFSIDQVTGALNGVADAARATNTSIDVTSKAIDSMSLSGNIAARQLVSLGLSSKDMAAAMGLSADTATKDINAIFKSLNQDSRLNVLTVAMQKFAGVAETSATTVAGQFNILRNNLEQTASSIGSALAPAVTAIIALINSDVIPFVKSLVDEFTSLPVPVQEVTIAITAFTTVALPAAIAGLGALGFAMTGIEALAPALGGVITALGGAFTGLAGAETVAAEETTVFAGVVGGLVEAAAGLGIAVTGAAATFAAWKIKDWADDAHTASISMLDLKNALSVTADVAHSNLIPAMESVVGWFGSLGNAVANVSGLGIPALTDKLTGFSSAVKTTEGAIKSFVDALINSVAPVAGFLQAFSTAVSALSRYKQIQDEVNAALHGNVAAAQGAAASTAQHGAAVAGATTQVAAHTTAVTGNAGALRGLTADTAADIKASVDSAAATAAAKQAKIENTAAIKADVSGLEQHLAAILQDTGAADLGVTASVKHTASMQTNEVATRLNTAAISDQIGKLVQDWQETNNAAGAKALDATAAKQQLEALQSDINAILKHSGASSDGISVTLLHGQALLTNTTNAKAQDQALQDAVRELFQHTQASQQGTSAVGIHSGALNLDKAAAEVQATSLAKSVTQILLHTEGLGLDATQLKNTVTWLLEHSKDLSAGIPILGGHTTALDANAKAAKDSVDPLIQRVAQLIQNQLNEKNGLATVIAGGKAMDDHAASAKVDTQALADLFIQLDKQRSVVGPVVDLLKLQHDDTVAASVATNAWLGPLGLAVIALDSQTRSLTAAEAPLHVVGNEADTTNTKMLALGSDGIPLVTRNTDLLLRMLPGVPPALDDIAGGMQIVYGHANDTSSAVNTLTKANKDLADQTQQTTQATQVWSSVLHDIPWWEGGTGSTMLTGNELALEFQTTKTTAALNAQSTALSQLASVAQSVEDVFAGLDAAMGGVAGLSKAGGGSISGTLGGAAPPGYYSSPGGIAASSGWEPPFHAAVGLLSDAMTSTSQAMSGTDNTSLTSALATASGALNGNGANDLTTAAQTAATAIGQTGTLLNDANFGVQGLSATLANAANQVAGAGLAIQNAISSTSVSLYSLGNIATQAAAPVTTPAPTPAPSGSFVPPATGTGSTPAAPSTGGTSGTGGGTSTTPQPIGYFTPYPGNGGVATPNAAYSPTTPSATLLNNPSSNGVAKSLAVTISAPITISGAQNPSAVAQQVVAHLKTAGNFASVN